MVAAAQQIIVQRGLDECTLDEVARCSGVAKTTFYRHFRDLDELVVTAIDDMIEEVATPDHGSLRADLESIVRAFSGIVKHQGFRQLFASMLSRAIADPEFDAVYRQAQEMRHAPLRIAIQRGMARGEVDPEIDLDQAMFFVQGPFVAKRLIENDDVTDRDIDVFLDLIVRALAPRR
jgi:AcrR family transcriptional regulator